MSGSATKSLGPWHRFVAMGDSFTEGIGDPSPESPGGYRGWADRVAEVLDTQVDDFRYANLAVRGKLIGQVIAEQLDAAIALEPDLVTFSAGANDVLRPGARPDAIAARCAEALTALVRTGTTVVVFTSTDTGFSAALRTVRGKFAIYNENIRAIAATQGVRVVDLWGLRQIQDRRCFAEDRLHLNAFGHHEVARTVLDVLGVPNDLEPMTPDPVPTQTWTQARKDDLIWARDHFGPWVVRRVRRRSSGDNVSPKRPTAQPVTFSSDT